MDARLVLGAVRGLRAPTRYRGAIMTICRAIAATASVLLVVAAILGCAATSSTRPPDAASLQETEAPEQDGESCEIQRPLEHGDLGCRCGFETFSDRHVKALSVYQNHDPSVIWLCNRERHLMVTRQSSDAP